MPKKQAPDGAQLYFSDRQVAERFGISVATVWRWSREGREGFPAPVRLVGTTRWRLADLEAFEQAAAGTPYTFDAEKQPGSRGRFATCPPDAKRGRGRLRRVVAEAGEGSA